MSEPSKEIITDTKLLKRSSIESLIAQEKENFWICGKKRYDRRCISYIVQTAVTVIVMLFAMTMIILTNSHDESRVVWITILSTIVGNAMPTSTFHSGNNNGPQDDDD